jgi:hypothetical protein
MPTNEMVDRILSIYQILKSAMEWRSPGEIPLPDSGASGEMALENPIAQTAPGCMVAGSNPVGSAAAE